jgi:hypothetical protein
MTYKSLVEKSEFLLDSFYLDYEDDDSFRSIKDDDEDDQSMRVDQSVKKRDQNPEDENSEDENSDSENSKDSNHHEDNLIETISSADSFTEMQSVRGNLISSSTDSSQSVKVDQTASLDEDELSVLMSDSKSDDQTNDQTNDQTDNHLIFDENNSLILNYSRLKIRHDYKQLHHRDFVKTAKQIGSIEAVDHDLVTLKIFEQIINDSQAKE